MISTKQSHSGRRAFSRAAAVLLAVASLAACSSSGTAKSGGDRSPSASSTAGSSNSPAALAAYFPGKKAAGTPVKIGLINDEGSSPTSQPEVGDAAMAAATYANDELGGISGHPIQVDRCAETEDSASATACANKMVDDRVVAVDIGTTGFGDTMVPIITKAGIPYVSASGSSISELNTSGAFMWTGGFAADIDGFAKYSAQEGFKKVVGFFIDEPASIQGAKSLGVPAFKAAGVGFTIESVPAGVADATPQVTAGLSSHPDAGMVLGDPAVCTSVLKALSVVDPGIPRMANTGCLSASVASALGSAFNGVKIMGRSDTTSSALEAQLFQYVMAKYAPKTSLSGDVVTGYQGMLGLVRAVAGLTGDVSPASMMAAIKAAKKVPLPAGAGLTFTCDGNQMPGLRSNCNGGDIILTVHNGKGVNPQVLP